MRGSGIQLTATIADQLPSLRGHKGKLQQVLLNLMRNGVEVTTIEGLSEDGSHPLQIAWLSNNVSQCGYCQPGMIMGAAALLARDSNPDDEAIDRGMTNICRCGT